MLKNSVPNSRIHIRQILLLVLLFAVCAVAGIWLFMQAPSAASAEEGTDEQTNPIEVTFNGEKTYYSDAKDAVDYINSCETSEENRATFTLLDNLAITSASPLYFNTSTPYVTLDLNGYILRGEGITTSVITVICDMIIIDSQSQSTAEEHQHDYYVDDTGLWVIDDNSAEWAENYSNAETTGTITGGVITGGNSSTYGGGIHLSVEYQTGGRVTMNGGTIAGNYSNWGGGGVFVTNYASASFVMNGGMIAGNVTTGVLGYGGAILANTYSTCKINGGVIKDNVANIGGGILANDTSLTINGGEIYNNYSADIAGGVYVGGGTLYLSGGKIYANTSESVGGGVAADNLVMSGGEISGNYAEEGGEAIYAAAAEISGGYISGSLYFESDNIEEDIKISGGYFGEGDVAQGTVYGYTVADDYTVMMIGENSGDSQYREGFPYAVYSRVNVAFTVDDVQTTYGNSYEPVINIDDAYVGATLSYSYEDAQGETVSGLPTDAGTYTVTATISYIDGENGGYYGGTTTFEVVILTKALTVTAEVGYTTNASGNITGAEINYISFAGVLGGDTVTVKVAGLELVYEGGEVAGVNVSFALNGDDAGNYTAEDMYIQIYNDLNSTIAELERQLNEAADKLASEVARLEELIAGKGDSEEIIAQLAALEEAYKAADALINSSIADLVAADEQLASSISALESVYKAADDAIWEAIEALRSDVAANTDNIGSLTIVAWVALAAAVIALAAAVVGIVLAAKKKKS